MIADVSFLYPEKADGRPAYQRATLERDVMAVIAVVMSPDASVSRRDRSGQTFARWSCPK